MVIFCPGLAIMLTALQLLEAVCFQAGVELPGASVGGFESQRKLVLAYQRHGSTVTERSY